MGAKEGNYTGRHMPYVKQFNLWSHWLISAVHWTSCPTLPYLRFDLSPIKRKKANFFILYNFASRRRRRRTLLINQYTSTAADPNRTASAVSTALLDRSKYSSSASHRVLCWNLVVAGSLEVPTVVSSMLPTPAALVVTSITRVRPAISLDFSTFFRRKL